MSELKCIVHERTRVDSCNWCGTSICQYCLQASNSKKYCPKCYTKISKNSVAGFLKREVAKKDDRILNIDPMMSKEDIKKRKQMLEIREKARKILGESL